MWLCPSGVRGETVIRENYQIRLTLFGSSTVFSLFSTLFVMQLWLGNEGLVNEHTGQ